MKDFKQIIVEQNFQSKLNPHRKKIVLLTDKKFYTEAFLSNFILVEYFSMKLIHCLRGYQDAEKLTEKLSNTLKDNGVELDTKKLNDLIFSSIYLYAIEKSEGKRSIIDISVIRKCLRELKVDYDTFQLNYLLSSQLNKEDRKVMNAVLDRKSIREKRNYVVHKNEEIDEIYYKRVSPFFDYFFNLITVEIK